MAVYNGARFLRATVQSILRQTFQNFEFIIVNDASTDDTYDILNAFAQQEKRIRVLTNERNYERAISRNIAIQASKGEYIAIMDADDVALPPRLEKEVGFLNAHPDIALVGSAFHLINEQGRILATQRVPTDPRLLRHALLEGNQFGHSSVMFRKSVVATVGMYRSELIPSEDYDFWLRISEKYNIANIAEPLCLWRIYADNSSASRTLEQKRRAIFAQELAQERRRVGRDCLQILPPQHITKFLAQKFPEQPDTHVDRDYAFGKFLYEKEIFQESFKYFQKSLINGTAKLPSFVFLIKICLKSILPRPLILALKQITPDKISRSVL